MNAKIFNLDTYRRWKTYRRSGFVGPASSYAEVEEKAESYKKSVINKFVREVYSYPDKHYPNQDK